MTVFLLLLTIIVNLILQITILPYFEILGKVPNTALIIVVIIALGKGRYYGGLLGMLIGFLQDILFSTAIGVNAIIYFFAGYLIGYVEDTFARDSLINVIIFTALATIYYNISHSFFMYFLNRHITLADSVRSVFSFEVIYNLVVSIIIFKILQRTIAEPKIRFNKR